MMANTPATVLVFVAALILCATAATPASFLLTFHTTVKTGTGQIVFNITRSNAPHGVDRLWTLLQPNVTYYNENGFFRVVPQFVVQFGISGTPAVAKHWENLNIPDDPVKLSNTKGTLSYATAGPNTRTTQLFINYADNSFLDKQGFAPLGQIVSGLDVALAINAQYGQQPDQTSIYNQGNAYLRSRFPNLDYITSASVHA